MCKKRNIFTMSELAAGLQTLFNRLNADFFSGELERCVITVQAGKHKHAYGWITTEKTWTQGSTRRHEINISSDCLNGERDIYDIAGTLLHEMCHLFNMMQGVQDCSRGGTYHNERFRDAATAHHMECERVERYGYCRTRLDQFARAWIDEHCPIASFRIFEGGATGSAGGSAPPGATGSAGGSAPPVTPKRKPSSTRKYMCGGCGMTVRATRDVKLICGECAERGELQLLYRVDV